jgi:hypothetical protein
MEFIQLIKLSFLQVSVNERIVVSICSDENIKLATAKYGAKLIKAESTN